LDLDGVLETETLGFCSTSPAGALALRALIAHGHRPVLVSGRSVSEVAERCRAYGLDGGVAEYGAVTIGRRGADPISLLDSAELDGLERARDALTATTGVEVGPDHRFSIRAWCRDARGRRTALGSATVAAAQAAAAPIVVRPVDGDTQTDLVVARVDKGAGVRALLDRLDARLPLALAVGDSAEDLPMLDLALHPAAPANAARALRRAPVRRLRRPYQAGVAEAVGGLLGHAPGGCPACAPPAADRRRLLLLELLGARERGRAGLAVSALRIVAHGRRR
jgi:3-deoxy-D-manno-octulosonate 8-phosphate phosphatase KdsC-like HAD superfamily phosphatase